MPTGNRRKFDSNGERDRDTSPATMAGHVRIARPVTGPLAWPSTARPSAQAAGRSSSWWPSLRTVGVARVRHLAGQHGELRSPHAPLPSGPLPPVAYDSLAPARGALFGAWVQPTTDRSSAEESAIVSLQGTIGRKLAINQILHRLGGPDAGGAGAVGSAERHDSHDLAEGRRARTGSCRHLRRSAACRRLQLKSLHGPVMLRYFAEMDNSFDAPIAGPPAKFIAAWRYIYRIFASSGGHQRPLGVECDKLRVRDRERTAVLSGRCLRKLDRCGRLQLGAVRPNSSVADLLRHLLCLSTSGASTRGSRC